MSDQRAMARAILTMIMLALLATGNAWAQTEGSPLTLEIKPTVMRCRSDAPTQVEVRLHWDGAALLEGRLVLGFHDGNQFLGNWHSPDMALTSGVQAQRFMLPADLVQGGDGEVIIDATFESKDRRISLGTQGLQTATRLTRNFVIAVSAPWAGTSTRYVSQLRALRLEKFNPDTTNRGIATLWAHVPPEEMPTQPLGYCAYDMLFLAGEGFTKLMPKQLDAIQAWVQAGGSLCVLCTPPSAPEDVKFLNQLASQRENSATSAWSFATDETGRLVVVGDTERDIRLFRVGLGRVMVGTARAADPALEPEETPWRQAAAFLWKVRANQVLNFVTAGSWRTNLQNIPPRAQVYAGVRPGETPPLFLGNLRAIPRGQQLVTQLMPSGVGVLPFDAIVAMLVLFVLVIGPGDFFFLGLVRQRKMTWLLFPAVTIGFTLATMALSRGYLGGRDYRRSMTLIDIGAGGRVLRVNKLELVFAASERRATTDVTQGLFSAVSNSQLLGDPSQPYYYYQAQAYANQAGNGAEVIPPDYDGRMPSRFTVVEHVQQWTPQLNRTLLLEGMGNDSIPWEKIDELMLARDRHHGDLARNILAQTPRFQGAVVLFTGPGGEAQAVGDVSILSSLSLDRRYQYTHDRIGAGGLSFLHTACVRDREGFFSIVSQLSPAGDNSLEDLAAFDSTDADERLVVFVLRDGDDLVVYRRLYHFGDP